MTDDQMTDVVVSLCRHSAMLNSKHRRTYANLGDATPR